MKRTRGSKSDSMARPLVKEYKRFLVKRPYLFVKDFLAKMDKLVRVVKKDGRSTVITHDVNYNRLNVEVRGGMVVRLVNFG